MPSVTVAEIREFLPVDYDVQDGTLAILIAGVDEFLERILGRSLATATSHTDDLDGSDFALWPSSRPVVSVTSITNLSTELVTDSDDYILSGDRIYRVDGNEWSDEYPGCWRVVYVGGEAAPAGLKMAILHLIGRLYDNHGGKVSQAAAGYGITWEPLMTSDIWTIIGPYGLGAVQVG